MEKKRNTIKRYPEIHPEICDNNHTVKSPWVHLMLGVHRRNQMNPVYLSTFSSQHQRREQHLGLPERAADLLVQDGAACRGPAGLTPAPLARLPRKPVPSG